jgi:pyruvate dehydrogenase complex dehydrogenase (E1) component
MKTAPCWLRLESPGRRRFSGNHRTSTAPVIRKKLVGDDQRIAALLAIFHRRPTESAMRRGGHDTLKVYTAYERAVNSAAGKPVAIIVKTVKGYGMGKAAEGKNKAHQTKDLSDDSRVETKNRYGIPISDEEAKAARFWFPGPDDPTTKYLHERRKWLWAAICPNALTTFTRQISNCPKLSPFLKNNFTAAKPPPAKLFPPRPPWSIS